MFRMRSLIIISILLMISITTLSQRETSKKADLIVFSFDRPLQLYALLESVDRYMSGLDQITVIYRTSNAAYERSYQEVFNNFSHVQRRVQKDPAKDFKPLVLQTMQQSPSDYVLYAVDDIIVTDYIDVCHAVELIRCTNAYGFYFRMGKNITWDYNRDRSLATPSLAVVEPGVCSWTLTLKQYNAWNYPHTVDLALYRKKEVMAQWLSLEFTNPNTLEARWHSQLAGKAKNRLALCYDHAKMINVPLNRVQDEYKNKHMELWTAAELLAFFKQGLKIDIDQLYQYKNRSVHMDYEPAFVVRQ